jgi:molybdopterin converting factor small subunit
VATVRLFASVREAAGTSRADLDGASVDEVLAEARRRYGHPFSDLLVTCRIWVNGEPAEGTTLVGPSDEVAVLPPVSGGT